MTAKWPRLKPVTRYGWAVLWRQRNQLDGITQHLMGIPTTPYVVLFPTRRECQAHIEDTYGYIRNSPDLLTEPHSWRVPRPVRVKTTVALVRQGGTQ